MKNGEEIGLVDVEKKKQTKKEIKIEPKDIVMDDMEDLERDERRMNIIGQNGNDGLHYEKVTPTSTELEILQNHLNNLKYYNDELYYENVYGGELDRITDTTQTLIVDKTEEEENEKRTLKYRKRK
jgi:hypothetical protein